jgi:multiple sugar transport system substrate-binding protein
MSGSGRYRTVVAALLAAVALPAMAEELQMWERSGGNAGVVDRLVAMWNEKNPDRKIVLTYIPHAEMVAKLAQAIASGEVPDLMGLDLIYGRSSRPRASSSISPNILRTTRR